MSHQATEFTKELFKLLRRMRMEAGFRSNSLLALLAQQGGVEVATALIEADIPIAVFKQLKELGRLDLSIEAYVVENPQWHSLFSPEVLSAARARLAANGYKKVMH